MFLLSIGALSRCGPFLRPPALCSPVPLLLRSAASGGAGVPGQRAAAPLVFDGEAYRLKSNWEIVRALAVFRLCSHRWLVNNAGKVMHWSRRLLGKKLFDWVMQHSVYGQFVAGETAPEIRDCTEGLMRLGVRLMLAVPIEEDVGEERSESWFEQNLRTELSCVELARSCSHRAMMQLKVTSLMSAELCATVTRSLRLHSGSEDFSVARLVEVLNGEELPFRSLTQEESVHFQASLRRLRNLGEFAKDREVPILIDAELTYLNPAISLIAMAMMIRFNQSQPFISNTYQCYLKETERNLSDDLAQALSLGLCFGVKLVRGAYMERERELALKHGYADPVRSSWVDTDQSYRKVLDKMVTLVRQDGPRLGLVVATHNEDSVRYVLARMEEFGMARDSIHFAQLLGMSDHVSLSLGTAGYSVYKSIPYGAVDDVIPYLVRRAQENRTALSGLRRERELLRRELRRRFVSRMARRG